MFIYFLSYNIHNSKLIVCLQKQGYKEMWKKLVSTNDLIVEETENDGLNVRIEARNNPEGWNIIKRYYEPESNEHSYIEDYYKPNLAEVKDVLRHIQHDLLTKTQIKKIKNLKRNFDVNITRVYHEGNVEKWLFSILSARHSQKSAPANEDGSIVIKYGQNVELDIMVKEKFRHYEEELIELINEKLGLTNNTEYDIIHNFYYYFDSTSYTTKQKKHTIPAILIK